MIMVKRGYVLVSFPACGDGSKFCDRSKSTKHYLRYQQTIENSFAFLINIQNLQRTGSYSSVNEQNPVVTIAIQFSWKCIWPRYCKNTPVWSWDASFKSKRNMFGSVFCARQTLSKKVERKIRVLYLFYIHTSKASKLRYWETLQAV